MAFVIPLTRDISPINHSCWTYKQTSLTMGHHPVRNFKVPMSKHVPIFPPSRRIWDVRWSQEKCSSASLQWNIPPGGCRCPVRTHQAWINGELLGAIFSPKIIYIWVCWDDEKPKRWNNKNMFQTTNQSIMINELAITIKYSGRTKDLETGWNWLLQ